MIVLTWHHPFYVSSTKMMIPFQGWSICNWTVKVDLPSHRVNDQVNTIQYHVTNHPYQIKNINNTFHPINDG